MIYSSLSIIIAFHSRKFIPYEKDLYPSIIIGSLIPDFDLILVAFHSFFYPIERSLDLLYNTFSHSFFSIIFIYLIFTVISEIKDNPKYRNLGKGLCIGFLIHIICDTLLGINGTQFLWPLPLEKFNLWNSINIPAFYIDLLSAFEFLFLRIFAWNIINQFIIYPTGNGWYIKFITKWMKTEFLLFIVFLFIAYLDMPNFKLLMVFMYIASLFIAIVTTILMWDSISSYKKDNV